MGKMLLLLAILISNACLAQKSKSIEICKSGGVIVKASIDFDETNNPTDTTFRVSGRDGRYPSLSDYIILFSGDIGDIYKSFKYCLKFYTNETDGTSQNYNNHHLSVSKYSGMKVINIYEHEGDGYTVFNGAMLKSLITKIEKWANTNKVSL